MSPMTANRWNSAMRSGGACTACPRSNRDDQPPPLLRPSFRLHAPRYLLHFAHHAERITAEIFEDFLIGEAPLHRAADQVRNLRNISHPFGERVVRPVEIGAQTNVVHTRHLYRV